jgi:hypothetical protein
MRRLSIVLVLAAACSDKLPDPPSPSVFAAMSPTEQCAATAPRAMRCVDELMVATVRQLTDVSKESDELAAQLEKDFASESLSSDEKLKIHHTSCEGEHDARYQKAIVACWSQPDCKAFARCVYPSR